MKNRKLTQLLVDLVPDNIYIHVGLDDIARGGKVAEIVGHFKDLIKKLILNTEARVCVSEIIACEDYKDLCKETYEINEKVHNLVSHMRDTNDDLANRLCTFNNKKLTGHLKWKRGSTESFVLTDRGKGILWLRLRYGLTKLSNLSLNKRNNLVDLNSLNHD